MCDFQQLEDRREATHMIQALTKVLVQPLETPAPKAEALQLLLVVKEEDAGTQEAT